MPKQYVPEQTLFDGFVPRSPEKIYEDDPDPKASAEALDSFVHCKFSLDQCIPRCELSDLDPVLIEIANELYSYVPYKVNCAYRSVEWDKSRGRNGLSSHCKGLAMDIATYSHLHRLRLVGKLLQLGVTRIGIAKNFIHFDLDKDKGSSLWLYDLSNVNKTF